MEEFCLINQEKSSALVLNIRPFRSGYRKETNTALIFFVTFLYQDKKVKKEKTSNLGEHPKNLKRNIAQKVD